MRIDWTQLFLFVVFFKFDTPPSNDCKKNSSRRRTDFSFSGKKHLDAFYELNEEKNEWFFYNVLSTITRPVIGFLYLKIASHK